MEYHTVSLTCASIGASCGSNNTVVTILRARGLIINVPIPENTECRDRITGMNPMGASRIVYSGAFPLQSAVHECIVLFWKASWDFEPFMSETTRSAQAICTVPPCLKAHACDIICGVSLRFAFVFDAKIV